MSDMAYIMETQDPHELWLVDGENKFRVSHDMYWLLASEGADLPPKHHITELLYENAKLREGLEFANDEWEKESIEFLNLQTENAELEAENGELRNENDSLRDLVVDLFVAMSGATSETGARTRKRASISEYERRINEMGIEVERAENIPSEPMDESDTDEANVPKR